MDLMDLKEPVLASGDSLHLFLEVVQFVAIVEFHEGARETPVQERQEPLDVEVVGLVQGDGWCLSDHRQ
jgi:hypothetical protein